MQNVHHSVMATNRTQLPGGLDPSVRTVLEYIAGVEARPLRFVGPEVARRLLAAGAALDLPAPDSVVARDDVIALADRRIPIRVYTPAGAPRGTVLFFHGGGFVMGDLESHHRLCGRLAAQSGARVVAVDYRLAPEHPFPAAVEDAVAAIEWVMPRLDELGGDGAGLAVAGDSAGGNLAAVVAQQSGDSVRERLRLQVLLYPATDMGLTPDVAPSMQENADGMFLTFDDMLWFTEMYQPDVESPLASPARAASLRGLPRTLVITAEFDPLRDDGERYAALLREAGVDVTLHRYDGQIHGFLSMSALVGAAHAGMEEVSAAVRDALR
jgi:acetyl esterase